MKAVAKYPMWPPPEAQVGELTCITTHQTSHRVSQQPDWSPHSLWGSCSYSYHNCSCLTLSQVTQAGGAKPGKNRLQQLQSQRLVLFNKGQGSPEIKWGGSPYAGFEVSSWWQSHLCLPLRDDTARVGSPPVCPQLWWWAPSAVLGMASPGTEGREYQGKQGSVWPAAVQF